MVEQKNINLRKLKTILSLDNGKKRILLEAYVYLAWARMLKTIPFSRLAPSLGTHMSETPILDTPSNHESICIVSDAIHIMSRHTFWESMCLVKAIAGMKMLNRRKIASTLYLGTAKDENGKMIAHAWLRSGSFYITGAEEKDKFTVVAKFANYISEKNKRKIQ